jgi:phosphopantothenoylcysteine synthetase/decarboxylase
MLRALPPLSQKKPPPPEVDILADVNRGVPVWVFPAMNTLMYEHPLTASHLKIVTEVLKYRVEGPIGQSLPKGLHTF